MNSYNNKNHNNNINNNYNKTNSTSSGFDLIVISLVFLFYKFRLSLDNKLIGMKYVRINDFWTNVIMCASNFLSHQLMLSFS